MMGPTLESATRPKESSLLPLPLRMEATPTPSDIINGTVIGPVVTPPESKDTAQKSGETKMLSTNATT